MSKAQRIKFWALKQADSA